jgi:hypothetical protein
LIRNLFPIKEDNVSGNDSLISRRKFIKLTTTALAAAPAVLSGATSVLAADPTKQGGYKNRHDLKAATNVVRVASVSTAVEGGILPVLVDSFRTETGLNVALTSIDEPYCRTEIYYAVNIWKCANRSP